VSIAATTGLLTAQTRTIGIYHDDPAVVPQAELRSEACITVPADWTASGELEDGRIAGGEEYLNDPRLTPAKDLQTAVLLPPAGDSRGGTSSEGAQA
jgi:hypothetical protein